MRVVDHLNVQIGLIFALFWFIFQFRESLELNQQTFGIHNVGQIPPFSVESAKFHFRNVQT